MTSSPIGTRITMTLIGAIAGVSLWLFIDVLDELIDNRHLYVWLFSAVAGFFSVLLALTGPVRIPAAALGAASLSLPAAALFGWASLRYAEVSAYLDNPLPVFALVLIIVVGTPFVAAMLKDRQAWRHYPLLFDISWTITVRYAAAWLFVGVAWAVIGLSNELLQIVGITVIEDLLEIDAVPYGLTGLVLGLALAVVYELRDYVSPFLILRLLRLLLPAVLVVIAVFIAALPFRGLTNLLGGFSPATTMLAMAWGAITLLTTALDKSDEEAVQTGWMRLATKALVVFLPVLAALAAWAIALRVMQYGWTPARLAAALVAGYTLAYALIYTGSVVLRGAWMARIRRANAVMALLLIAGAALWLTPVLNAERISTASQLARVTSGSATPDQAAIWEMQRDWGKPGQAGVAALREMRDLDDHAGLTRRLDEAARADSRASYDKRRDTAERGGRIRALHDLMPVLGGELGERAFVELPEFQLIDWLRACRRDAGDGAPGCALVLGAFIPSDRDARGILFLLSGEDRVDVLSVVVRDGRVFSTGAVQDEGSGRKPQLGAADLRDIQGGGYEIRPSSRRALWLGDTELIPNN